MSRRGRPPHPDILTPREWEVLALLREGLSNEEIAQRLDISLAGAKYHVSEILSKLAVSSREEAAQWSASGEERPWWTAAGAPVAFFWRRTNVSWLTTGMAGALVLAVAAGIGLLIWGLLRTDGGEELAQCSPGPGEIANFIIDIETTGERSFTGPASSTIHRPRGETVTVHVDADTQWVGDIQSVTELEEYMQVQAVGPRQADCSIAAVTIISGGTEPIPRPVTFAPGETVSAEGPGIFFLDPETGATEGWVIPGENRFALTVTSISADGGLVLFTCREQYPEEGLGPCNRFAPDSPFTWYLLNTETGERTQLPHVMEFRSFSPDGSMLLGETADGLALASVSSLRTASVTALSDVRPLGVASGSASWSPDSASIIVRSAAGTFLVRADSAETVQLLPEAVVRGIAWAPDSSKVVLVLPPEESTSLDSPSGIFVFDGDGNQLWHRPAEGEAPNPRWSADGEQLAVQVRVVYEQEPNVFRLDVFDGATGEPRYRIPGAIACSGRIWTADGSRLVVGSYGLGAFVGDPNTGTFRRLEVGAKPSLTDPDQGIGFDGFDFYRVDLSSGEFTHLAETTVEPAWFSDHEPLFVGERIVFTAPHGGHGGCAVCCGLDNPPEPAFRYPPFDD